MANLIEAQRIAQAYDNAEANVQEKDKKSVKSGEKFDVPSGNGNFYTNNYGKFQKLKGNRKVLPKRKKNIIDSINKYGLLNNPIIVNELFEIVDGQARFEVFREAGLPILYSIQPGLKDKDACIAINRYGQKWDTSDYIASWVDSGNKSYTWYQGFIDENHKAHSKVTESCLRPLAFGTFNTSGDSFTRTIKEGRLSVDSKVKAQATKTASFLQKHKNIYLYVDKKSTFREFCYAMYFLNTYFEGIDMDPLKEGMEHYLHESAVLKDTGAYIEHMDKAYKWASRKAKVSHLPINATFNKVKQQTGKATI